MREGGGAPRRGLHASISSVTVAPEGAGQRTRPPVAIFRFGTRSFFVLKNYSTFNPRKFEISTADKVQLRENWVTVHKFINDVLDKGFLYTTSQVNPIQAV